MSIQLIGGLAETQALRLAVGNHASRDEGRCATEVVAWLESVPHSDHPVCTSQIPDSYDQVLNQLPPWQEHGNQEARDTKTRQSS